MLSASEKQLLNPAVGNTPSLADVVKIVQPAQAWRAAWFAWLIGKPFDEAALPSITQSFERFKRESAQGWRATALVLKISSVFRRSITIPSVRAPRRNAQ